MRFDRFEMAKQTVSGPLATPASRRTVLTGVLSLAAGTLAGTVAAQPRPQIARHAIAMHGEPALGAHFRHLPYANPDAPRGGRLLQGVLGTFDNVNPFIVKGLVAQGIRAPLVANSNVIAGYVIESLMARSHDEPFTLYGLVAQTVETDAARSYVTFNINPAARFSDGKPLTPEDVLFTWQLLREKGRPNHRTYYAKVTKAEVVGTHSVRFDFGNSEDRELPLILGLMPVLSKHSVDVEKFEALSFTAPAGSGPYVVASVDPGKSITLARDPNHWGRDLPINRGFWNFDEIRFDYYRDATSFHEAFKKGLFDLRTETDPGRWQTMYDFPALRDGRVIKETFPSGLPKSSFFFVFNTRRGVFADIRVREAISLLFDFEWVNRNYYFDLYRRTGSYFDGSELSARGRPADARERALLAPFPDAVRRHSRRHLVAAGNRRSGRDRAFSGALKLLADAGYDLRGGTLVEVKSGRPLSFEIVVVTRNESIDEERLALSFATNLKRAGITALVRRVDAVQFEARRLSFEFDMIQTRWDQSLSPGNEQSFYWSSAAADSNGSRNYMGAKSPAIDALIDTLLKSQERAEVVAAVRAIDRVLLSGFYTVPLFHLPEHWVARWSHPASGDHAAVRLCARTTAPCEWPTKDGCGDPGDPNAPHVVDGGRYARRHLRGVARDPDYIALVDPPNRPPSPTAHRGGELSRGRPRGRRDADLRRLGLPVDAVVGLQRPTPSKASSRSSRCYARGVITRRCRCCGAVPRWPQRCAGSAPRRLSPAPASAVLITACSLWRSRASCFRSGMSVASASSSLMAFFSSMTCSASSPQIPCRQLAESSTRPAMSR